MSEEKITLSMSLKNGTAAGNDLLAPINEAIKKYGVLNVIFALIEGTEHLCDNLEIRSDSMREACAMLTHNPPKGQEAENV